MEFIILVNTFAIVWMMSDSLANKSWAMIDTKNLKKNVFKSRNEYNKNPNIYESHFSITSYVARKRQLGK